MTIRAREALELKPHFAGELALANVHPGLRLYAQLDGAPADSVPIVWRDVLAGRHLVSFSGPGVLPWTAEIQVASGRTASYDAEPRTSDSRGELEVTSTLATDQGAQPGRGDAVRIDSRPAGRKPVKLVLAAGTHSVRVDHAGIDPRVELVEIRAGQTRYVKVEFDGTARARVEVAPPFGSPAFPFVAASFHPAHHETVREMRLFFAPPDEPAFARRAMTLMDAQRGIYAGPLPPLDGGHPGFKYYVIVIDSDFNEIASEVLLYGRAPGPAFPRRRQALPARNLVPKISRADMTRPVASIAAALPARPETTGVHVDGR